MVCHLRRRRRHRHRLQLMLEIASPVHIESRHYPIQLKPMWLGRQLNKWPRRLINQTRAESHTHNQRGKMPPPRSLLAQRTICCALRTRDHLEIQPDCASTRELIISLSLFDFGGGGCALVCLGAPMLEGRASESVVGTKISLSFVVRSRLEPPCHRTSSSTARTQLAHSSSER